MVSISRNGRVVLLLFVIAAVVRVAWVGVQWSRHPAALQFPDEEAYLTVGRSLVSGNGLVDEFGFRSTFMPAYPAFIAAFAFWSDSLLWMKLCQAILAAWVAPGTFLLACAFYRRTPGDAVTHQWGAILAGILVAFDPFLIFFAGLILTEALFAAVLVSAWALVFSMNRPTQPAVWSAGLLLLLCVMLRPSAIVLVIALPIVLFVFGKRTGLMVMAVVLIGLFPWALRNRITLGEWRWLTTRGGISLYDGVREGAIGESDLAHTKSMPELKGMTETQWDRYWRAQAYQAVKKDPKRILELGWKKFTRTWSLIPNVTTYRQGGAAIVSAFYMLLMLLSALAGIIIHRREPRRLVLLLLPVMAFTLLHMIYVGSVRYRVPVMPMLAVLSGAGLARCVHHWLPSKPSARD